MKLALSSVVGCILASVSTVAGAATIDFSSVTTGQYSNVTIGDYMFSRINGQNPVVFTSAAGFKAFGDDTSNSGNGSVFTLSRIDGGSFNVSNVIFGLSASAGNSGDTRIDFGSYDANRTYVRSDGQAYVGNTDVFRNTASLFINTYTNVGSVGIRSLDVSAVPEPASWALMPTGFGAVGYSLRRRKAAISFA